MKQPKYVHGFIDRHGAPRFYLRRPGLPGVKLPGLPWSPEFMAAYEAGMSGAPLEIGVSRSKPGTVSSAIASYYKHELWIEGLSPASKAMRRAILERFREEHGEKRVALLQPQHVSKILANKQRYAKRNWLKTLRGFMAFCVAEHHVNVDPTAGIKLIALGKTTGFMTWKEEQIEQ